MPVLPVTTPAVHPLVVQHNALVNAQFNLNTTESRLFLAMLARISPQHTKFARCRVEMHNILDVTSNNYVHIKKIVASFGKQTLRIEKLNPDGGRRRRIFTVIPLVQFAEYREGEGYVEAQFNNRLLPYLLQLRNNFTKAQLDELIKLKSHSSFRIYWLLREYATFGKRTVPLEELKAALGLEKEYGRFNNFRVRVLDQAQKELADTDTPFTFEPIKAGRDVVAIEFRFHLHKTAKLRQSNAQPLLEWEEAVLSTGVASNSLPQIRSRLVAGDYELGYVRYVLDTVKSQLQAGKIKREGGAVFKALADGYMLPAYHKAQQRRKQAEAKPRPKPRNTPAVASRLKKIASELEDKRNSLRFTETASIYTDEERISTLQEINRSIAQLEQERQQLMA